MKNAALLATVTAAWRTSSAGRTENHTPPRGPTATCLGLWRRITCTRVRRIHRLLSLGLHHSAAASSSRHSRLRWRAALRALARGVAGPRAAGISHDIWTSSARSARRCYIRLRHGAHIFCKVGSDNPIPTQNFTAEPSDIAYRAHAFSASQLSLSSCSVLPTASASALQPGRFTYTTCSRTATGSGSSSLIYPFTHAHFARTALIMMEISRLCLFLAMAAVSASLLKGHFIIQQHLAAVYMPFPRSFAGLSWPIISPRLQQQQPVSAIGSRQPAVAPFMQTAGRDLGVGPRFTPRDPPSALLRFPDDVPLPPPTAGLLPTSLTHRLPLHSHRTHLAATTGVVSPHTRGVITAHDMPVTLFDARSPQRITAPSGWTAASTAYAGAAGSCSLVAAPTPHACHGHPRPRGEAL